MRFVDTNILIYSVSSLPEDAAKCAVAVALLQARDLALSVRVLQEFYVQATRPTRPQRLTHDEAASFISAWLRFPSRKAASLWRGVVGGGGDLVETLAEGRCIGIDEVDGAFGDDVGAEAGPGG